MIIIVGPNTGAYMGAGGGVRVALNMTEALAETGVEVALVAAEGLSINELDSLHGTNLVQHQSKGTLKLWYFLRNNSLHIPFPLKVRLLTLYLADKISKGNIDLIIFHDDVPKPPIWDHWPCRAILYAHFPYMARLYFNISDPSEERVGLSVLKERIVRITTKGGLFVENRPHVALLSNSSITKMFIDKIWGGETEVLFPPISVPESDPTIEKNDLVTVIGAIQPNKRIGDIIMAFAQIKVGKLFVVGRIYERWYYERLLKMRNDLGLQNRVEFVTNADERTKIKLLSRSKAILSAARFEPFGISVVEGMRLGCIPIVYQGDLSGPWVDICDRGRYGLGFRNYLELAKRIELVLSDPVWSNKMSVKMEERSKYFSLETFKNSFIKKIEKTLKT